MDELFDGPHSSFPLAELDNVDSEAIKLRVSHNSRLDSSHGWVTEELTLAQVEGLFLKHGKFERKRESPGYVPGVIQGDCRKKPAVSQLDCLIIDLDKGEDVDDFIARVRAEELYALIHSSHSHLTQETEILLDDYRKFTGSNPVTEEGLRSYLLEKRKYRQWVVKNVEVAEPYKDTPTGAVCVAHHEPLPKYHAAFPLRRPFSRQEHFDAGGNQSSFEALWKDKYAALANSLGVEWDKNCTDISRASCKPDAEMFAKKITGKLLDLDEVKVERSSRR
jgi:hypothetical protein